MLVVVVSLEVDLQKFLVGQETRNRFLIHLLQTCSSHLLLTIAKLSFFLPPFGWPLAIVPRLACELAGGVEPLRAALQAPLERSPDDPRPL